jgi:hypothetical protein
MNYLKTTTDSDNAPFVMTIGEISNKYRISRQTILSWIHTGQLIARDVSMNSGFRTPKYRILMSDVEQFFAGRVIQPSDSKPADTITYSS